jgi:hypothetical protein
LSVDEIEFSLEFVFNLVTCIKSMDISEENWAQFKAAVQKLLNHEVGDVFLAVTREDDYVFILHHDSRLNVLTGEVENFKGSTSDVMTMGPVSFDGKYIIACIGKE